MNAIGGIDKTILSCKNTQFKKIVKNIITSEIKTLTNPHPLNNS